MNEATYRHEFKYYCNEPDIIYLNSRLSSILDLDSHTGKNNSYTIRSLYFDTYDDKCYFENENGTDPREKFRIRIYNADDSRISLECKRKENGKTYKSSVLLNKEQYNSIINNDISVNDSEDSLLRRFVLKSKSDLMRPVVIVEYDRIPYVWKDGNVRVTFDKNIRASADINHFFDKSLAFRPVLSKGVHLMEFKYDEFYPKFIKELLDTSIFSQTAFSKYYLCRKYLNGGLLL